MKKCWLENIVWSLLVTDKQNVVHAHLNKSKKKKKDQQEMDENYNNNYSIK